MTNTVLVSIDGLRPDAVLQTFCPNLEKVQAVGAATMQARSVMPSMTLPCHMSIFHSVPPERHGILTNEWQPMVRPLPGLVEVAKQHNKSCAFFYNWENLRDLSRPGQLEHSYFVNCAEVVPPNPFGDHLIAETANEYLSTTPLDFAFVYLGTIDVYGHMYGWMTDEYLGQIERVDEALGILLDGLPEDTTVLVQSDHGGHDRIHGTNSPEDMIIPWIIKGPTIRQGITLNSKISLLDTAPTLAHVLNIPAAPQWEGHCIYEAFVN